MQQMELRSERSILRPWPTGAALALALAALAPSPPVLAQPKSVASEAGPIAIEKLASGLEHPWGMAFLPDGRLLVTERAGRLRILGSDGTLSDPLAGLPEVFARGQGGLLDVALHPDFESERLVYLSFAEASEEGASTALGRGRLEGERIENFDVVFRQRPAVSGPNHFGGRIVFASDAAVFLTLGERFKFEPAQDLSNHLGTIVRIELDGATPEDNPFVERAGAADSIWSYGHRNIEAAALHPETGDLWIAEMGPLGGDELNQARPGRNYGWPVVSWGRHYSGEPIPDPPTHPEFADAAKHWTPVIAPSGMVFYTGDLFPEWRGSALIGGLVSQGIVRVEIEEDRVTHEERVPLQVRVRDVEQAPDGSVYVLTDQADGGVWRLGSLR